MNLWQRVNLLRHSRGFGVHSPLAYRLITEVLTPYGQYEDYPEIKRRFGRDARLARMVYRLLAWLEPGDVTVLADQRWQWLASRFNPRQGGGLVLVARPPQTPDEQRAIATAMHVVVLNADTPEGRHLLESLTYTTLTLDTHRRLAYATRAKGLPCQTIHLRTLLPSQ